MRSESRQLQDLISVGPAMLRDFELLGVRSVAQLARRNPERLYRELGRRAERHHDICVLDTFRAAVAQARDPRLPAENCQWWWWTKVRKAQ
jgi:nucleotidyltransferase/DNA polymerase involved in DNA repair